MQGGYAVYPFYDQYGRLAYYPYYLIYYYQPIGYYIPVQSTNQNIAYPRASRPEQTIALPRASRPEQTITHPRASRHEHTCHETTNEGIPEDIETTQLNEKSDFNSKSGYDANFECDICADTSMADPLTLKCSHNICLNCASRLQDSKNYIKCPFCREITANTKKFY